ncbi:MAG: hypothetical protein ACR2H3_07940, partial [Acidimicrobiales bacterium]
MRALRAMSMLAVLVLTSGACGAVGSGRLAALPRSGAGSDGEVSAASSKAVAADAAAESLTTPRRRVVYEAGPDLAEMKGTAPAYKLSGRATVADVRRLAKTLGLSGDVREESGTFVLTDGDRFLEVSSMPGGGWYLSNERADSGIAAVGCAVPDGAEFANDCEVEEPPVMADLPTAAQAERKVRDILAEARSDKVAYDVKAGDATSWGLPVEVSMRIGGKRIIDGVASFTFGSGGELISASAWLGTVESIGDYPLAGTAKGIERLNASGGHGFMRQGVPEPAATDSGQSDPAVSQLHDGVISSEGPVSSVPPCPPEAEWVAKDLPARGEATTRVTL